VKQLAQIKILAALAFTFTLGACSTPQAVVETKPIASVTAEAVPAAPVEKAATKSVSAAVALPPYLDPASLLNQKRSIYFGFDQYTVKPEFSSMLELHGKYLAANPQIVIKVQGNTDEKGGAEYNLALGQKRAEAVVKMLKIYGVKDSQLEAVSFGKEKPKALGHDDAAHAQNRRADLAYPEN